MSHRRLAIVQHGDFREALALRAANKPEPYFGMYHTLEALEACIGSDPHLIISLNAPDYFEVHEPGQYRGFAIPGRSRVIPGRLQVYLWAWRVVSLVKEFRPTHVLLRSGNPVLGSQLLQFCSRNKLPTMVILAGVFQEHERWWDRWNAGKFIEGLNDPCVFRVGNHKQPATDSMIARGVATEKAQAYDWPPTRHPSDFEPKQLQPGPIRILYVGVLSRAKGVGDLINAARRLLDDQHPVQVDIVGDGPERDQLEKLAAGLPAITFHGRLANDEVFEMMCRATLSCVPSRPIFSEGMPMTLTEALASRTPVIASDHPVFVPAFKDGEGLVFFKAEDDQALAAAILKATASPEAYLELSKGTAAAFARVECPTSFASLLEDWRNAS